MSTRSTGRLPTHELTARRHRKQTITKLPALLPYRAKPVSEPRTRVPGNVLAPFPHPLAKLNPMF